MNCSTPRLHTKMGVVDRPVQALKILISTNFCLTECVKKALNVMRFAIHSRLKITPFEFHHGRTPRTELTNLTNNGKSVVSSWSELSVLADNRPKSRQDLCVLRQQRRSIKSPTNGPDKRNRR